MNGPQGKERRPQGAAFVIAGGLAALAAVLLWDAAGLKQDGGYAGVGPGDVPRLVAYGLLILSGLTLLSGLRGEMPRAPRQEFGPVLWILGGMGLQLALLYPLGFSLAGAALFGMTARGFGRGPLWLTCGVGLGLSVAIYGLFDQLLELHLPAGWLETTLFGE